MNDLLSVTFGHYSWNEGHLVVPSIRADGTSVNVWNLGTDSPHILRGHTSYVYPVAISSDGGAIISGSWDKTARVWDGETGAERFVCGGHSTYVGDLDLDEAHGRFVTVDLESTYRLWNVTNGQLLNTRTIPLPDGFDRDRRVKHAAFTLDGKSIIGTSDTLLVKLDASNLDTEHQVALTDLLGTTQVTDLEVAPSGNRVGIITRDQARKSVFKILDAVTFDVITSIQPGGRLLQFKYSPDGSLLAFGFSDGSVGIWDVHDLSQPRWRQTAHSDEVFALAFSPDGTRLFSGSDDSTIRIWDTKDGDVFGPLVGHEKYVYSMDISSDGRRLVSGSGDGTVRIWETWPYSRRAAANRQSNPQVTSP